MVHLEYKSLVTNEIINYYLSRIKDEKERKDFTNTISKFDIRISTKPVIKDEESKEILFYDSSEGVYVTAGDIIKYFLTE